MEPMSPEVLIRQVESLPGLMAETARSFYAAVHAAFNDAELRRVNRVYLTGDGDSYHAAEAAALAFEEFAGVPCEPISAQRFLDYSAEYMPIYSPTSTLVVGISASGRTARGVEALAKAREVGAFTAAMTGQAGSPFTQTAARSMVMEIEDYGPSPGIRTYQANLAGLCLLAIEIGAVKGRLDEQTAAGLVDEIAGLSGVMQATLEAGKEKALALVEAWQDADRLMCVGSGPSYGTALFSAAKIVEAAGVFAVGQDLEEWSHVERFSHPHDLKNMPMFVFAPRGRSRWRAGPLVELASSLGRRVAVVAEADDELSDRAAAFFPVAGKVREAFSPLVYHLVLNYFASYLTTALGRLCFRTDNRTR